MTATSYLGKPTSRIDGHAKVTGLAKYAAEYNVPGLAHGFVVSSAIAKGRIKRIDTADALSVDGVLDVARSFSRRLLASRAFRRFLANEPETATRILFSARGGVHGRAVEATKRAHVAVYTVCLLSQSGGQKAEDSLVRIAEASGGRSYFPSTVDEARSDMERVARDLREQYTLGYFSSNPTHNGAWRSVRIELVPPPGMPAAAKLNANYRHGYYGPGDSN